MADPTLIFTPRGGGAPAGNLYLFAWANVSVGGVMQPQSTPNLIDGISFDDGVAEVLMLPAAPDVASVGVNLWVPTDTPGFVGFRLTGADTFEVRTYDLAGVLSNRAFSVRIYRQGS